MLRVCCFIVVFILCACNNRTRGETPFEEWESDSVGNKVVSEWTNRVDLSYLKPGDIVTLSYAKGFQGAAVLNNVSVVSQAK